MGFRPRSAATAFLTFTLLVFSITAGYAQQRSDPPVTVKGFDHFYVETARIHMNICQDPACVVGSKVSYTVYAPERNPDFEQYKNHQKQVEAHLKAQSAQGTTIRFGTPERAQTPMFTTFKNSREVRSGSGQTLFTTSTTTYTKTVTISLISSSTDKSKVDENGAPFMAGLLIWSESLRDVE